MAHKTYVNLHSVDCYYSSLSWEKHVINIETRVLLDNIAQEIGDYCSKWGRIRVGDVKEKYGTVRVYVSFGVFSLHDIFFPRRYYRHPYYPKWLWTIDLYNPLYSVLSYLILPYQTWIYKRAYKKALNKYCSQTRAIIAGMDYPELILKKRKPV